MQAPKERTHADVDQGLTRANASANHSIALKTILTGGDGLLHQMMHVAVMAAGPRHLSNLFDGGRLFLQRHYAIVNELMTYNINIINELIDRARAEQTFGDRSYVTLAHHIGAPEVVIGKAHPLHASMHASNRITTSMHTSVHQCSESTMLSKISYDPTDIANLAMSVMRADTKALLSTLGLSRAEYIRAVSSLDETPSSSIQILDGIFMAMHGNTFWADDTHSVHDLYQRVGTDLFGTVHNSIYVNPRLVAEMLASETTLRVLPNGSGASEDKLSDLLTSNDLIVASPGNYAQNFTISRMLISIGLAYAASYYAHYVKLMGNLLVDESILGIGMPAVNIAYMIPMHFEIPSSGVAHGPNVMRHEVGGYQVAQIKVTMPLYVRTGNTYAIVHKTLTKTVMATNPAKDFLWASAERNFEDDDTIDTVCERLGVAVDAAMAAHNADHCVSDVLVRHYEPVTNRIAHETCIHVGMPCGAGDVPIDIRYNQMRSTTLDMMRIKLSEAPVINTTTQYQISDILLHASSGICYETHHAHEGHTGFLGRIKIASGGNVNSHTKRHKDKLKELTLHYATHVIPYLRNNDRNYARVIAAFTLVHAIKHVSYLEERERIKTSYKSILAMINDGRINPYLCDFSHAGMSRSGSIFYRTVDMIPMRSCVLAQRRYSAYATDHHNALSLLEEATSSWDIDQHELRDLLTLPHMIKWLAHYVNTLQYWNNYGTDAIYPTLDESREMHLANTVEGFDYYLHRGILNFATWNASAIVGDVLDIPDNVMSQRDYETLRNALMNGSLQWGEPVNIYDHIARYHTIWYNTRYVAAGPAACRGVGSMLDPLYANNIAQAYYDHVISLKTDCDKRDNVYNLMHGSIFHSLYNNGFINTINNVIKHDGGLLELARQGVSNGNQV